MGTLTVIGAMFAGLIVLAALEGRRRGQKAGREGSQLFERIVALLEENPTSRDTHSEVWGLVNRMDGMVIGIYAGTLYQVALGIVQDHPEDSNVRVLALGFGRLSHGSNRPDGRPTIYDEQAIQNDIQARTGIASARNS